jgi:hypothetical protein
MGKMGRSGRQQGNWQCFGGDGRVSAGEAGSAEGRDVIEIICGLSMWVLVGRIIIMGLWLLWRRSCSLGEADEVRLRGGIATGGACPSRLT